MSQITVIGEALVDVVANGPAHPGGSPMNVAVGLSRLGHQIEFSSEFAEDEYGALLAEHLSDSGVQLAAGSQQAERTSSAHVELDPEGNAQYTFDISWTLPNNSIAPGTELVHTGSIAASLEPGGTRIVEALRAAPESALISYDPNIRPALMPEREESLRRVEELVRLSHVVKLSDVDAEWLYPEMSHDQVLAHLLSLGPVLTVMTQGPSGCLAHTASRSFDLESVPTTVVDTIGAGDAFMSGLLYGILEPQIAAVVRERGDLSAEQVNTVLRHALRSAALTVAVAGANPPRLAEFTAEG